MKNPSPPRVLQLVASSHGGAATHIRDVAFGLPPDQYTNLIGMPLDGGNVTPEEFSGAGIKFVPVSIASGFSWREIVRLRQLIRREDISLLHVHGARAALFGRLAMVGLRQRPRVIFTVHGFATPFHPTLKRQIYLGLEKALQHLTDCTICVAQAEADLFLSFGLTRPEKVRILSYGIDVARFAQPVSNLDSLRQTLGLLDKTPILTTVCRLNIPRDFDSLLSAFQQVRQAFPNAYLLIVGDGPQRTEVEAKIQSLRLGDAVQITGFRNDIPKIMALTQVYVLTSYGWEGYPISTLEAQAAGVPVVVTDAGGSGEAVQDGHTGFVVPKKAPDQLAQAILRLLDSPDLHRRMGSAGQERAQREFTKEAMCHKMDAIYEQLRFERKK